MLVRRSTVLLSGLLWAMVPAPAAASGTDEAPEATDEAPEATDEAPEAAGTAPDTEAEADSVPQFRGELAPGCSVGTRVDLDGSEGGLGLQLDGFLSDDLCAQVGSGRGTVGVLGHGGGGVGEGFSKAMGQAGPRMIGFSPNRPIRFVEKMAIKEVITQRRSDIRACYARELTKNPTLGGTVTIEFVVAENGSVSSASVKSSTLDNTAVTGCITELFMQFRFPEPEGGGRVRVSYPFDFSPG